MNFFASFRFFSVSNGQIADNNLFSEDDEEDGNEEDDDGEEEEGALSHSLRSRSSRCCCICCCSERVGLHSFTLIVRPSSVNVVCAISQSATGGDASVTKP